MVELKHVRFRLSELIEAVNSIDDRRQPHSVTEALEFYWNWARQRCWELVAVSCSRREGSTQAVGRDGQVEVMHNEVWDVIWQGEDARDGSPDLVGRVQCRS